VRINKILVLYVFSEDANKSCIYEYLMKNADIKIKKTGDLKIFL